MDDAEKQIMEEAEFLRQQAIRDNQAGKLSGKKRRKEKMRIFPGDDPRNPMEALFITKYGSPTPVPEPTKYRTQKTIAAAIYFIHYGKTIEEAARLSGLKEGSFIFKVRTEDKWEEFAQELMQLAKPSNLTTVPLHDLTILEDEMLRRKGTVEALREKERSCVLHLKKTQNGSKEQSAVLSDIKKIRELIDDALQLDSYHRELSAARTTLMQAAAKDIIQSQKPQAPRQIEKGQIVEI